VCTMAGTGQMYRQFCRVCASLMFGLFFLAVFSWGNVEANPTGEFIRSYDSYRVYRSTPETEEAQAALGREIKLQDGQCEFMKEAHKPGLPSDFMCHTSAAEDVLSRVKEAGLGIETMIDNVGSLIREGAEEHRRIKRQTENMNWDNYQRYDTIIPWLEQLAVENPGFISLTDMGRSHEGRKIIMLKVGNSPRGSQTRAVWVDGGIHAREWIAVATATFLLDNIVNVFKTNDTSTREAKAVQSVDWYLAPLLNPDGYEFSHTSDRMWRKNRSPPPPGWSCYGTDLNRNWDVIGFGVGASSNPCSDTYKGTARNSEPETKVIAEAIQKYKSNIRIYLSFHSYGQYWLSSFGYKTELPVDNEKLVTLGRHAVDAIQQVTPSRTYTIGSAGVVFHYAAGGASDDYAKAAAEIPYSFTVELPDSGQYGFLLPPNQIRTVGAELWAATSVLAEEAARHPTGADPAREEEMTADIKLGLHYDEPK